MNFRIFVSLAAAAFLSLSLMAQDRKVDAWYTSVDRSQLISKSDLDLSFSTKNNSWQAPIIIDEKMVYQEIDGLGFALTGGSAEHLLKMTPKARRALLEELFGRGENQRGISLIRLTIGASDLNSFVFSYDDMPQGKEDWDLQHFSLSQDLVDVVPVMKEILSINPDIYIMGSPWSGPAWMKTKFDVRGGKLRKECYGVYANYFVKYVKAMAEQGIHLDAVTIQNEPLNSKNTPSMPWMAEDQKEFVRDHMGPAFRKAGLDTKIITFDHNCDRPDFPLAILADPEAAQYVAGSAFHHYAGDMTAMTLVHNARPDKDIWFTEQMTTERPGNPELYIAPSIKRTVIDVFRNWSRNTLLWNLASDPQYDPHTDNGGCSGCQGAITLLGDHVSRFISYYTIAQISQFVPRGSHRIASTAPEDPGLGLYEDEQAPGMWRTVTSAVSGVLPNVAFMTPDGKIVLVVVNTSAADTTVKVQYRGEWAFLPLKSGSAGTFVWNK